MLAGMAPQAEAAESSSYPVAPNALVKEIQAPVIVNKLIEGREPAEGETFTFHVEPISEQAVYYAENGYLTYDDTITAARFTPPVGNDSAEQEGNLLSYLAPYLDVTEGMWGAGLIYIYGHEEIMGCFSR